MGAVAGTAPPCCAKPPTVVHTLLKEEEDARSTCSALDESFVVPTAVDASAVLSFRRSLEQAGIDTSGYGKGNAKPLEVLYYQVREKHCTLEAKLSTAESDSPALRRVVEQVQITFVATLDGMDNVLVQVLQAPDDGPQVTRKQLLVHKLVNGQTWKEGVEECFEKRFQIPAKDQRRLFSPHLQSYSYREMEKMTESYPGLSTLHKRHQVAIYVENPLDPILERIGLPDGLGFSCMEGKLSRADARVRLNAWAWELAPSAVKQGIIPANLEGLAADRQEQDPEAALRRRFATAQTLTRLKRQTVMSEEDMAKRVPLPTRSTPQKPYEAWKECPSPMLAAMAAEQKLDVDALDRATKCIRNRDYSLRNFFDDCLAAFPELCMYTCLPPQPAEIPQKRGKETAPERLDDEYQRTIGALFAFYWLMRLDMDGKDGLCFGVDNTWAAKSKPTRQLPESGRPFPKMSKAEKRTRFHSDGPWASLEELLVNAGLWTRDDNGVISAPVDRVKAMLILTAVHDLMKVEALMPVVQAGHGPFCGHKDAEELTDHRVALAYMMQFFPHHLPSIFAGLASDMRQLVMFTQSRIDLKLGWLVQAEAPPGKLLRNFKYMMQKSGSRSSRGASMSPESFLSPQPATRTSAKGLAEQDVSFYFVHWLTDLAGAVPTPLAGSEKLVLQLPHAHLSISLRAFTVLRSLATEQETTVYENYLRMCWNQVNPPLPEMPPGLEAVCCQRLVCMAQQVAPQILAAFERLPPADQRFLSEELATTGCQGQSFDACGDDLSKKKEGLRGVVSCRGFDERPPGVGDVGPAFLLHYGSTVLQRNGEAEPDLALQMLVGVLRAGRAIWPSSTDAADETACLRMDLLKECTVEAVRNSMVQGEVWLLVWHSAREAFVERHPLVMLNSFNKSARPYQVLILLQGEQLSRTQRWF